MKYCDLQVNGAFGVDFNCDDLTLKQFEFACANLARIGVTDFLPTIITDSVSTMSSRIHKIAQWISDVPHLAQNARGIHIEGPFLSSLQGFYGTHPPQHIQAANTDHAMRLLDAGLGKVKLLTLAPEQDPSGQVIRRLKAEGVLVFAGHTDASYAQLSNAIDCGLVGFTHLGNGCVHQVNRQDNILQRVLALKDHLTVTLIADGIHLPAWLLRSWLSIFSTDRCILISDSMSAAGMPAGAYSIGGQPIQVDENRRTLHRDHGYLAGSASTLADIDLWLQKTLDLDDGLKQKLLYSNAYELLR